MKSIIQSKKECFICRINYDVETTTKLHKHHCFEDITKSNKFDLKIWLYYRHHVNDPHYSMRYQKQLDLELKQLAQQKFEENHTRKEFIEHFIKSYL